MIEIHGADFGDIILYDNNFVLHINSGNYSDFNGNYSNFNIAYFTCIYVSETDSDLLDYNNKLYSQERYEIDIPEFTILNRIEAERYYDNEETILLMNNNNLYLGSDIEGSFKYSVWYNISNGERIRFEYIKGEIVYIKPDKMLLREKETGKIIADMLIN